jgi:hypothetical protein
VNRVHPQRVHPFACSESGNGQDGAAKPEQVRLRAFWKRPTAAWHSRFIRGCGHWASKRRAPQKLITCGVGSSRKQSVEAPVVGVYGENLYLAEAGLKGVLTKQRGTHDGSGCRGLRVSHGAG